MRERDVIINWKGGGRERAKLVYYSWYILSLPEEKIVKCWYMLFLIHNIFCHRSSCWDVIA